MFMSKNFDQIPTIMGYSEEPVGVIAGCGSGGFGGVVLHEPTDGEIYQFSGDLNPKSLLPIGYNFHYEDVATVTVSGLLEWTNFNLRRAPEGRQDVMEAGPVRIEVFDSEQLRRTIEAHAKLFEKLGMKFIG